MTAPNAQTGAAAGAATPARQSDVSTPRHCNLPIPFEQAALDYARRGWPVLPLRPGRKEPACSRGHLDATVDEGTIVQWWSENPNYNVGISPRRFIVLDVDGDEGKAALVELMGDGELPETVSVATPGGGLHFYLRCDFPVRNRARFAPGLDLRTERGYVVAPPSVHPGGGTYRWILGPAAPIAACPDWLAAALPRADSSSPPRPEAQREGAGQRAAGGKPSPAAGDEASYLESALAAIDASDYDAWIRIGQVLHDWDPSRGLALWDRWSSAAPNYSGPEDTARRWAGFGRGDGPHAGLPSLFHAARRAGWRPDPGADPFRATTLTRTGNGRAPSWSASDYGDELASGAEQAHHPAPEAAAGWPFPAEQRLSDRVLALLARPRSVLVGAFSGATTAKRPVFDAAGQQNTPEGFDRAVACTLASERVPAQDIAAALLARPDGHAREQGEDYVRRIVDSARAEFAKDKPSCNFEVARAELFDSTPPRVKLYLVGHPRPVELTTAGLLYGGAFDAAVLSQLHFLAVRPSDSGDWRSLVAGWLASADVIEEPPEASPRELAKEQLRDAIDALPLWGDGDAPDEDAGPWRHDGQAVLLGGRRAFHAAAVLPAVEHSVEAQGWSLSTMLRELGCEPAGRRRIAGQPRRHLWTAPEAWGDDHG